MAKPHRTVARIASILESVADHPEGRTFSSLVRALDAPKSSVHALVQGLLAVGYLSESGDRFVLGPGIEMLVMPVKSGLLRRVAHEHLRVLSERTEETAQLGIRVGYNVAFIDQVESPQKIRYVANLRERRPLLTTSMGKIFLASMDDATLRKFLNNRALDDQAAVARFLKEMKQIRQEGVSFNREESVEGVYAVGAGIRNESSGPIIAAVSVAGPAFRMTPHLACTTDEVSRVARAISESLTQRSWS